MTTTKGITQRRFKKRGVVLLIVVGFIFLYIWYANIGEQAFVRKELTNQQTLKKKALLISSDDHILGSMNAGVLLIEYSDSDCRFCGKLKDKLKRLTDEYDGDVTWVYRHFQLPRYPYSDREAEAMECMASLKGEESYRAFRNRMYEIRLSESENENIRTLVGEAQPFGVNEKDFRECLESRRFRDFVDSQKISGSDLGVTSVPHTFIISRNGDVSEIKGNKPLGTFRSLINRALEIK